ncbi:hypothetical protein UYSO10_2973 [Kosakonia radicincitans]|nr:hypothetical protein UYSO10_2973 [Kosakonia radicincitans]
MEGYCIINQTFNFQYLVFCLLAIIQIIRMRIYWGLISPAT